MLGLQSKERNTFPSYRRVKTSEEYRAALHAEAYSNKWFVVCIRKNKVGISRLGLIISKKIAPRAVDRNFAKRLIKEIFRLDFPTSCTLDVIVRLRRPLKKNATNEMQMALAQLLINIQAKCVSF